MLVHARIFSSNNAVLAGTTLGNAGSIDAYVAKFNSSGIAQWYVQVGGSGSDGPQVGTNSILRWTHLIMFI